jgi:hypothetical protein
MERGVAELDENDMSDLPLLVPAEDPPDTGAWVLAPVEGEPLQMDLTYAYFDEDHSGVHIRRTQSFDGFGEESVLIPGTPGRIWVYCPTTENKDGPRKIYQCTNIVFKVDMKYSMPKASQIVTDGDDGIFMLVPTSESEGSLTSPACIMSVRYPDGRVLVEGVPRDIRLIAGSSDGVLYYFSTKGLCYCFKAGVESIVLGNLSDGCLFAPCNRGEGVLVLHSLVGESGGYSMLVDTPA